MENPSRPSHLLVGAAREPSRWRGWHPLRWVLLVVGTVVHAWLLLYVVAGVFFFHSGQCGSAPYLPEVEAGRRILWWLLAVVALPWVGAVLTSRHRLRFAVAGAVATAPVVLGVLNGMQMSSWRSEWCLF